MLDKAPSQPPLALRFPAIFWPQCLACGSCLEKCPQQIYIPEVLERVVAEMEGPEFRDILAGVAMHLQKELK